MLLWERWKTHAAERPAGEAIVHWTAGEAPVRWRWRELLERAARYALALRERGVRRQEVCALILRHHREFYPLYMGISALGALPAVLAYPNQRLHPAKFRQGLEGMARRSGLKWVLTERALDPQVRPLALQEGSTVRDIMFPWEWRLGADGEAVERFCAREPAATPEEPCLLQHSSGTTGLQKAVVLSHRAVLEHTRRYGEALGLNARDRVVSWLPLYHDMGLIAAFHLPLAHGIPSVQLDPFEWVVAPVLLLEALAREKASLAWLPNFAYNLMADRVHVEDLAGLGLEHFRMLINSSEVVRHVSHERFVARFAPLGFRRQALAASYAMAETTFAVTQTAAGEEPPTVAARREELARGRFVPAADRTAAKICVSSGRLISGCEARIVDEAGRDVPDEHVGEIAIRSVSLFDGYMNNPEATRAALRDGWCFSGDYGFRRQGEYYVIGRKKDILIVAGKNLYPEDIEDAVSEASGVLAGRVVAFGQEDEQGGTEQVCVIAETELSLCADRRMELKRAVVEAGMRVDVTISRVYLAPPRWLIKSSSGKPSRGANKARALAELELA